MQTVEAEGPSIDAAIEAALAELGVSRERVAIEILHDAARGFLGIGGRNARVRATIRPMLDTSVLDDDEPVDDVPPPPVLEADDGEEPSPPPTPAIAEPRPPRDATPDRSIDAGTVAHAREVLETILGHIDVEASVRAGTDGDHVTLEIDGDSSGLLIGRKGQMLDALEYIIGRILARDEHRTVHVVVDSQGYRERRQASLEELARRMAAEARRRRRAVTLNPMSPRDRRIVHLALQDEAGLTTRSAGQGHYRKLVIVPDGAPRSSRR